MNSDKTRKAYVRPALAKLENVKDVTMMMVCSTYDPQSGTCR